MGLTRSNIAYDFNISPHKALVKYNGFEALLPKNEVGAVKKEMVLPDRVEAPVCEGSAVGEVIYKVGEREIGRAEIVACESIDELSFGSILIMLLRKCASVL